MFGATDMFCVFGATLMFGAGVDTLLTFGIAGVDFGATDIAGVDVFVVVGATLMFGFAWTEKLGFGAGAGAGFGAGLKIDETADLIDEKIPIGLLYANYEVWVNNCVVIVAVINDHVGCRRAPCAYKLAHVLVVELLEVFSAWVSLL